MSDQQLPTTADAVLFLHNPNCSKSRAVKALLDEAGQAYRERLYLESPLDTAELAELGERLGRHPREWVRSGQAEYQAAGLDANSSPDALLAAMAADPILMERPIVVRGDAARVGRPPVAVLELFED
ncbi:MAG: arsenate reductase (glutaredoxin) [Planctomycetota bacterium]|nr:arsenate reductase (glutaredoxin) [Planctomycetota bacterium]